MKILAPLRITDAMLVSHSVPEDDAPEWAEGTQYDIGQKVLRKSLHLVYQAKTKSTGKKPESSPEDWHCLGATNRWAMFDEKIGTASTAKGEIRLTLRPGAMASGLALVGVTADSVQVRVTDAAQSVLFERSERLTADLREADWWHYFFDPISRRTSFEIFGLPAFADSAYEIILSGESGEQVACAACLLGEYMDFAPGVRPGARIGIMDYSLKKPDEWGNIEVVERAFSQTARWSFQVPGALLDRLYDLLASIRARPGLFIGGKFAGLKVYGFYREFDIVIEYDRMVECSIDLEGLI